MIPNLLKYVQEKYPIQNFINGDATHADILTKAGIEKANGLFATTDDDNTNLVITFTCQKAESGIKDYFFVHESRKSV